jgi:hypothetical protein
MPEQSHKQMVQTNPENNVEEIVQTMEHDSMKTNHSLFHHLSFPLSYFATFPKPVADDVCPFAVVVPAPEPLQQTVALWQSATA